ncbi:6-phosphogluconolactonase [Nitratireductor sp. CAU 1489]|uniref:6-phosphogluconolactonase n=1 Tax=Nitratireductor arenosus TaxID=2682096 RepID=A0A844QN01_9HYPH|nr:6-phosphogluconolactonase [Nitratireductor arenosus]MVA99428.1 6-phosphogluconolactonase [Nitratireductor arenosus]
MRPPPPYGFQAFEGADALAEALAETVAGHLDKAVGSNGRATLAVSGGTTPARFFRQLSQRPIDWERVTVTLVDERLVPPTAARSNERLVRETLLRDRAEQARFVGLWSGTADPAAAATAADERLADCPLPLDAVVLGMGLDGHTASYFPDAENLDTLLDPAARARVLPVRAQSAGEDRLTLTLPLVARARFLALHIEGEAKRTVFEQAMQAGTASPAPIRAVFERATTPPTVYWAPSEDKKP